MLPAPSPALALAAEDGGVSIEECSS